MRDPPRKRKRGRLTVTRQHPELGRARLLDDEIVIGAHPVQEHPLPRQGMFVEPQATIAAAWTDMDNFTFAGNSVKFGDETDVRGRLGLRVGTSHLGKDGTLVEPFVVGSVWGNFSGDNKATITSFGTTFGPFTDKSDDVWGVVSGGLNVFSPDGKSSAFAKADFAFGDDLDGLSAKLGMRYNW